MDYILKRPEWYLPKSAATPESVYQNRRALLKAMGMGGMMLCGTGGGRPNGGGTGAGLAMLCGVTVVGRARDRIVNAVMGTLTNPEGEPETSIGDGYSTPYAAYQALVKTGFVPVRRGWVRQALIWLLDSPPTRRGGPPNPIPVPAPRPK